MTMPTVFLKRDTPNTRKDMEFQAALSSFLFGCLILFWPTDVLNPAPAFRGLHWYGSDQVIAIAMIAGGIVQFVAPYFHPKLRIGIMLGSVAWYAFLFLNAVFSPATADPAAIFLFTPIIASLRCCAVLMDGYRA